MLGWIALGRDGLLWVAVGCAAYYMLTMNTFSQSIEAAGIEIQLYLFSLFLRSDWVCMCLLSFCLSVCPFGFKRRKEKKELGQHIWVSSQRKTQRSDHTIRSSYHTSYHAQLWYHSFISRFLTSHRTLSGVRDFDLPNHFFLCLMMTRTVTLFHETNSSTSQSRQPS